MRRQLSEVDMRRLLSEVDVSYRRRQHSVYIVGYFKEDGFGQIPQLNNKTKNHNEM
ncbi:unnamed protein product, partial [Ilex paraguariensis]